MKCVPKVNRAYWTSLTLASIFGANAGDFLASDLHLGHVRGLPYLAAGLTAIFVLERAARRPNALYFWTSIILIRAAATNIGDIFHDFGIGFSHSIPLTAVLLIVSVAVWRFVRPSDASGGYVPINGFYWVTIFLAGVLGTVGGDAVSYGLALGNLRATIVLGLPLGFVFFFGRNGALTQLYYYWFTVVLIRSAGTAAGDWLAHRAWGLLDLRGATAVSGAVFCAFVLLTYIVLKQNTRSGAYAA